MRIFGERVPIVTPKFVSHNTMVSTRQYYCLYIHMQQALPRSVSSRGTELTYVSHSQNLTLPYGWIPEGTFERKPEKVTGPMGEYHVYHTACTRK
jgi:hypothetical protein